VKKVNEWVRQGRENCNNGDHWFMLDYGDRMVCPVCGKSKPMPQPREDISEYNAYIVCTPEIIKAEHVNV